MHVVNGEEKPVAYVSRTLSPAEVNYAHIEREALAIIFGVKRFNQYLYGHEFILVTDHRPLCKLFGHADGVRPLAAARMQRWAMILSAYSYKIEYVPGPANQCADCLSRLPVQCSKIHPAEEGNAVHAMHTTTLPVTAIVKQQKTRSYHEYAHMCNKILGHFQYQKKLPHFIERKKSLPFQMAVCCGGSELLCHQSFSPRYWASCTLGI